MKRERDADKDADVQRDKAAQITLQAADDASTDYRIDITLALDEFIYSKGRFHGAKPKELAKAITQRIDAENPPGSGGGSGGGALFTSFVAKDDAKIGVRFNELLKSCILVDSYTDVAAMWKNIGSMTSGIISAGWEAHAVGLFFNKLADGTYKLAVMNTGRGSLWHGACLNPISVYHPEVPGLLIFRPITSNEFERLCSRLVLMRNCNINDKVAYATFFYRLVLNDLFKDDAFAPYWITPWKHPMVAFYMRLPIQSSGDCVFRSIFFTMLADDTILPTKYVNNSPTELGAPLWFWSWYGKLVAQSIERLLHQRLSWRFAQSELTCMRNRAESLIAYVNAITTKSGKAEQTSECIVALKKAANQCNESIMDWYKNTILCSRSLLPMVQHVQVNKRYARFDPTAAILNNDNTIRVFQVKDTQYSLNKALTLYHGCKAWTDFKTIGDELEKKRGLMGNNMLSRGEVIALTHAVFRIIRNEANDPATTNAATGVHHGIYQIVLCNAEFGRNYDMVLLYGMCYIALRRSLPGDAAYSALFNKFGGLDARCFDGPVHSSKHAYMISFVVTQLQTLRVMVDANQCQDELDTLYFATNKSLKQKDALKEVHQMYGNAFNPTIHKEWRPPYVYLHFLRYLQNLKNVKSEEYLVPTLIFLGAMFNHGVYFEHCVPLFINTLEPIAFLEWKPLEGRDESDAGRVDLLNPFKLSFDILFDPKSVEHNDNATISALQSPSDFYITFGACAKQPSNKSVKVFLDRTAAKDDSANTIDAARYNTPTMVDSVLARLPKYETTINVIDDWIRRLLDDTDTYTLSCNTEEWNLMVYAMLYLDGLYQSDDNTARLATKYARLVASPRCMDVLKLLIAVLGNKKYDARDILWSCTLNSAFSCKPIVQVVQTLPVRNEYSVIGPGKHNFSGMYSTRVSSKPLSNHTNGRYLRMVVEAHLKGEAAASLRYAKVDDICYDWIMNHVCHEAVDRWAAVCPKHDEYLKSKQSEIEHVSDGRFIDCLGNSVSFYKSPGKTGIYEATFCCKHQFTDDVLTYSTPLATTYDEYACSHDVSIDGSLPIVPQHFSFTLDSTDATHYTFNVMEPLPPHIYFQTQFAWTAKGGGSFYGEPVSTNTLKINSYCLLYTPSLGGGVSRRVVQTKPVNKSRCDFAALSASTSSSSAVIEFVPTFDVFKAGSSLLRSICAQLLCFCYNDRVLVWRISGNEHRIELLSHGVVLTVTETSGVTFANGMRMLLEAPSNQWAFWTYQMPTVFLAEQNGQRFLLSFDVQRRDNGVLDGCACAIHDLFGDNSSTTEMSSKGVKSKAQEHEICMQEDVAMHTIRVHQSGTFLLPTSYESVRSLHANAYRFGRNDVVAELDRLMKQLALLLPSPPSLHQAVRTNFAREDELDRPNTRKLDDPLRLLRINAAFSIDEILKYGQNAVRIEIGWFLAAKADKRVHAQSIIRTPMQSTPVPPDYRVAVVGSNRKKKEDDLVLFRRGILRRRHINIMHDLGGHVAEYVAVNLRKTSMPLGYAQFAFIKHLDPRPDQLGFANAVTLNFTDRKPQIHNLIMGGGKTAMVTPLVIMNSIYGIKSAEFRNGILASNNTATASIVLVLPHKLLSQTVRLLSTLGLYMDIPVSITSADRPHFWLAAEVGGIAPPKAINLYGGAPPAISTLYISSDRVLKESLLRRTEVAPAGLRYLLDEADMMLNPYTSELNIPQDADSFCSALQKTHPAAGDLCLQPIIELLFNRSAPVDKIPERVLQHLRGRVEPLVADRVHRLHYGHVNNPDAVDLMVNLLEQGMRVPAHAMAEIKRFHGSNILAIPYAFADAPSVGSDFADPMLAVALTVASLKSSRLDRVRIFFLLLHMFKSYRNYATLLSPYMGFLTARNRWQWVAQELSRLQADDALLRTYVLVYVPQKLTVFNSTLSACGLDLVMSGYHELRSGFTGTPDDDVHILDHNPIDILTKIQDSITAEATAMRKLTFEAAGDIQSHIIDKVAARQCNVIIDVGSQFLGISPVDLMCDILTRSTHGGPIELVYWDDNDRPAVIDRAGTIAEWNGTHAVHQIVYYDHAHTTGTDAVLNDDTKACMTIRQSSRYRDFVQGLFRLRKIVKSTGTRCAVIAAKGAAWSPNNEASLTMLLLENERRYLDAQKPVRAQQNALALIRSTTNDRVVPTSIDYMRKADNPFTTYLQTTIKNAAAKATNPAIKQHLTTLLGRLPKQQTLELEGQVDNEAQQETEQETERMQLARNALQQFVPMPFNVLLDPTKHLTLCNDVPIADGLYVSKNYAIFGECTSLDKLFRPLILEFVGSNRKIVVLLADAVLFMDYLDNTKHNNKAQKPAAIRIVDRAGNVWFEHPRKQPFAQPYNPAAPTRAAKKNGKP